MFVFHIWLAIILVVANQVEGFLSLSKVRMRTTALRETPTEAEVWLEDLFDFTVEALPELLAPMSWSGDAASIRLNPPKFRKLHTLETIHRVYRNESTWAAQDEVDAYFKRPHVSLPVKPGDISVLVLGTDVFVSFPDSLDSLLGTVELDPIGFIGSTEFVLATTESKESTARTSIQGGSLGDMPSVISDTGKRGLFPAPDATTNAVVREKERLPPPPAWYRSPEGRTVSPTAPSRKRLPAPEAITTPPKFKPSTMSKLKERLRKRPNYFG